MDVVRTVAPTCARLIAIVSMAVGAVSGCSNGALKRADSRSGGTVLHRRCCDEDDQRADGRRRSGALCRDFERRDRLPEWGGRRRGELPRIRGRLHGRRHRWGVPGGLSGRLLPVPGRSSRGNNGGGLNCPLPAPSRLPGARRAHQRLSERDGRHRPGFDLRGCSCVRRRGGGKQVADRRGHAEPLQPPALQDSVAARLPASRTGVRLLGVPVPLPVTRCSDPSAMTAQVLYAVVAIATA